MDWFRQLGRASRNLRSHRPPEPGLGSPGARVRPFRIAGHLFRVLLLTLAVIVVLTLGSTALVWYTGIGRYPMLHGLVLV